MSKNINAKDLAEALSKLDAAGKAEVLKALGATAAPKVEVPKNANPMTLRSSEVMIGKQGTITISGVAGGDYVPWFMCRLSACADVLQVIRLGEGKSRPNSGLPPVLPLDYAEHKNEAGVVLFSKEQQKAFAEKIANDKVVREHAEGLQARLRELAAERVK